MKTKRILAIGDVDALAEVRRVLRRAEFEMHRVPAALAAAPMARQIAFDLVIVVHPLPDREIADFHRDLRAAGPSSDSRLLVLLPRSRLAELAALADDPRLEAVELDGPAERLGQVVARYLGPVRVADRFRVRLRTAWPSTGRGWTVNVSVSGALIARESGDLPPLGERGELELTVRAEEPPIRLAAEVVRHAEAGVTWPRGFVLSWVALPAAEAEWLEGLLASLGPRVHTAEWPLPAID
jgi:hypothetical protein